MRFCTALVAGVLVCLTVPSSFLRGQEVAAASVTPTLTLAEAEAAAIANQPRLLAAQLRSRASAQRIREARSAYMPTVGFNATGALVADTGSSTATGNITTSAISDRFAYGGNLVQLVTDFGRTSALVGSAQATAEAQRSLMTLTRAQIRLNVREAYYQVLGAEAVLRAAEAAHASRQLISRQLSALAQSELRSTLDVNFAKVLESQAELAVVRAQSVVAQQRGHLATAMGSERIISAKLIEVTEAQVPPAAPEELLAGAQTQRADLGAAQAQQHAAAEFALSEKRLSYPTLNVLGTAGQIPYRDHTLHDSYAAAGFNLNIPIFNGGLFTARRTEAELEANARSRDVQEVKLQVTEQVRNAWYQTDEAYRSLDVSARLVAQSKEALRLAQDRYEAGLGSIVELNEAQLNETSAEITSADATYTYLSRHAELDFAAGLLN
ncbi:TolC family protein [Terriglobus saanensis]|uniref:Outer membrane efflux protein n=1 Tax=Terriglobus saanensis (strain ATCC BAA-1853 / DSM 23119 / SP1PR4) TaxID=401053 RepID=E8V2S5_TERSS|nr:TolC family protein [Terriglobus saanensis]ADV83550.1 outer membrane efflux protein [Terriglobus saanensis SP1PR4]